MKKTILALLILGLVTGTTAIANYNGSSDGDMHIMKAGPAQPTALATQSGGSGNGSNWSLNLEKTNSTCMPSDNMTGVTSTSFHEEDNNSVTITGNIEGSNPCATVSATDVIKQRGLYTINITTNTSDEICTECVGSLQYEMNFSYNDPADLEILHNGDSVRIINHTEAKWDKESNENHFRETRPQCGTGEDRINTSSEMVEGNKVIDILGSVSASNPCHSLNASFTETADQITLNVSVVEPESMACVRCLGSLNYEAQVSLENGQDLSILHEEEQIESVIGPELEERATEENQSNSNNSGNQSDSGNRTIGDIISSIIGSLF